ncbi:MAG TPA: amidase family protein, partial [Rubrobacter sp.]|nr:amidase family protein [Rubrobacter sp.]
MIQVSTLVFIAQSIPPPPQVSGTLDEAGDPRLWFRIAGRLSTGPPHREKETITASEICFLTATELVRLVRAKELSALEVMEAHLAQIERVNPEVNAIVTLTAEQAMDLARATDDALARGEEVGLLCGLPVAHKDLFPTEGVRTTFGSLVYKDFVPDHNALIVERLKGAGAISVGKTNTPEFGAGSQTFNEVFGETLNPYDP